MYTDEETAEIEYCIGGKYWGHGHATEALDAVIDFALSKPQFHKLEEFHRAENTRSGKALEKSYMKKTDMALRFRLESIAPGNYICYAVTRDMFAAM